MSKVKGLVERLRDGEHVLIAEGYMWELEHRGYVSSGSFTPEVVIEHPEMVESLSQEFAHAGSDIIQAFTYYGHRAKLSTIEREDDLAALNLKALKIARQVADMHGKLMAGGLSNTTVYKPDDSNAREEVLNIFKEQLEWAVEGRADLIIGETFTDYGEAALALEAIQKYGNGLPAVITIQPTSSDVTYDGVPLDVACRLLEEAGAAVVGLNCARGPDSMLPIMAKIRQACKGPVACIPVPFRTSASNPTFQDLKDARTGGMSFPLDLDPWQCSRSDVRRFAEQAKDLGIQYLGLCCGNRSIFMREIAEAMGRSPPASKYRPDMSKHISQIADKKHEYVQKMWHDDHVHNIPRDANSAAKDTS